MDGNPQTRKPANPLVDNQESNREGTWLGGTLSIGARHLRLRGARTSLADKSVDLGSQFIIGHQLLHSEWCTAERVGRIV